MLRIAIGVLSTTLIASDVVLGVMRHELLPPQVHNLFVAAIAVSTISDFIGRRITQAIMTSFIAGYRTCAAEERDIARLRPPLR